MRDTIKDKLYFERYIQSSEASYKKRVEKLRNGKIKHSRIRPVKIDMIRRLIRTIAAKYSLGLDTDFLVPDYTICVDLISDSWTGQRKLIANNHKTLDQYSLDAYDDMIWMLSLGYLLNVPIGQFKKLVIVIDQDNVRDKLFESIISAKIPSRQKILNESFEWVLFRKLREATDAKNKDQAALLVKQFLEEDWYKEHKNAAWYDNHKSDLDTYSGYWSFEAAAIAKILNLDDNSFKTNEYYPKDLV